MTPFQIAVAIRNKPDDGEPEQDFVLRTMSGERTSDFVVAVDLLESWDQAFDDFKLLLDLLRPMTRNSGPDEAIDTLIARSRQRGYSAALEALLARKWRCPHCKQFATINNVEVPFGDPDRMYRCMTCGEEGIAPVKTEARIEVRDGGKSGLRPI